MKIVYRKTSDLIPYVNNARTHDEEQVTQIASSIKEFGFTNPVLIDLDSGIIAGHGRVRAAQKLNLDELPCIVLKDLSEAQKKAYIIADNKLALNSGWNEDLLKIEIEELQGMDFDIDLLGFDSTELDDILSLADSDNEGLTDPDEVPETPDKAISIQGDLWLLGNHRLMCGDSTEQKSVTRLMNDKTIDMIFTDPPYGVSYSDKNKLLNSLDKGNRIQDAIKNDHMTVSDTSILWSNVFKIWSEFISDKSSYYITSPQMGELFMMMMMMMNENGIPFKHVLIWNKSQGVLGQCDYNYKHEPILYGWANTHKFYGEGEHKTSVWDISKPHKSDLHPTMKPIELIENCILNSTIKNQTVADMFGGSGSTLIACEKTNRHCFMMELSEHYCDVIIKRWQDFTGKQATLEATGQTFEERRESRE